MPTSTVAQGSSDGAEATPVPTSTTSIKAITRPDQRLRGLLCDCTLISTHVNLLASLGNPHQTNMHNYGPKGLDTAKLNEYNQTQEPDRM